VNRSESLDRPSVVWRKGSYDLGRRVDLAFIFGERDYLRAERKRAGELVARCVAAGTVWASSATVTRRRHPFEQELTILDFRTERRLRGESSLSLERDLESLI
jgi:hypothetical protein